MESFMCAAFGGGGWIRTNVGVSQQIYSLPPLATRAPLRRELMIMGEQHNIVKTMLDVAARAALTYKYLP